MSTQKAKFELYSRLEKLGFSFDEAYALRRIEMTLHRWAEQECGDGNDHMSWSIERDETTGKPYRVIYPHNGPSRRYPIADREAGALRRLTAIIAARNERYNTGELRLPRQEITYYHQTDPRGCALYLLTRADLTGHDGEALPADSCYTRGLAVCA